VVGEHRHRDVLTQGQVVAHELLEDHRDASPQGVVLSGVTAVDADDVDSVVPRALHDATGDSVLRRVGGWDRVLSGEYAGGTDLSGGQWQRVALARALAAIDAGAGVLVLDEPTAALDVRAEAELFDNFLTVTRGLTTILVSHRLSSVRHADRIVVLDGGRIVEDGTHDDLVAAGNGYARMFRLQAERFAMAGGEAS
jgi:ABC-type multidrug transport system fused ATPase/permease subunit